MVPEATDADLVSLVCLETLDEDDDTFDSAFSDLDISAEMELVGDLSPLPVSPFDFDASVDFSSLLLPAPALPLSSPPDQEAKASSPQPEVVERVFEITPRKRKREVAELELEQAAPSPPRTRPHRRSTSEGSTASSSSSSSVEVFVDPAHGLLKRVHPSRVWCAQHCSQSDEVRVCDLTTWREGYQMFEFK